MWVADLLSAVLGGVFDFFDRSDTLYAAYRKAWEERLRTGEDSPDVLSAELKRRSVPGAYDVRDSVLPHRATPAASFDTIPRALPGNSRD